MLVFHDPLIFRFYRGFVRVIPHISLFSLATSANGLFSTQLKTSDFQYLQISKIFYCELCFGDYRYVPQMQNPSYMFLTSRIMISQFCMEQVTATSSRTMAPGQKCLSFWLLSWKGTMASACLAALHRGSIWKFVYRGAQHCKLWEFSFTGPSLPLHQPFLFFRQ